MLPRLMILSQIKLSASIMCADLGNLREQIKILEQGNIDMIHFDVMDGHFVPNLALSPMMLPWLKPFTSLPFDVHLMVKNPEKLLDQIIENNVEFITVHIEILPHYGIRLLNTIRKRGVKVGIAINPLTSIDNVKYFLDYVDKFTIMTVDPGFAGQQFIPSALQKVKYLAFIRKKKKLHFDIEVDGSINSNTFEKVLNAGANVLVLGASGLFNKHQDLQSAITMVKNEIEALLQKRKEC